MSTNPLLYLQNEDGSFGTPIPQLVEACYKLSKRPEAPVEFIHNNAGYTVSLKIQQWTLHKGSSQVTDLKEITS